MIRNYYNMIKQNYMFDNNIISMEKIPLKQDSSEQIMLMIDRILNHF